MKAKDVLVKLDACNEAVASVGELSVEDAWNSCKRGDWLLWLSAKLLDRKKVVRVACALARTALVHVPANETRPIKAIETAEAWCDGKATLEEVRSAAYAANAAANAAAANAAYAAANAAYAAANAAYAAADANAYAYAAANAAYAAANAAYAATNAYAYADAYAARKQALKASSDLVKSHITAEEIEGAL